MSPNARYRCASGCSFQAEIIDVVYRCPRCHGLLEVEHALEPLRSTSGEGWRVRFDERWGTASLPGASGIWSKQEWVLPSLAPADLVSLGEGRTPLQPLGRLSRELGLASVALKQCGISPTGSFKDLGMTVLVSAVRHMRRLGRDVRAVVCASTGDTSAALAAYCAAAEIPSAVLLPKGKVSVAQLVQPLSHGARVLALETDFDGCMAIVQELAKDTTLYLANSMNSLRLEGQKTVAIELVQQRGWRVPDWVVIPGGNLGNASALAMGFELMLALGVVDRRPRIAVAQAELANPLARSFRGGFSPLEAREAGPTLATAIRIGNPVSFQRAVRSLQAFEGVVGDATEAELSDAAARADREGAFCCPQTGVALAVLEKLARDGTIAAGSDVVVVATAHGLKFESFKEGYHRNALPGIVAARANPPLELPAELGAVRAALRSGLP